MKPLLTLAHFIDRLNQCIGRAVSWLILATVLISAGNAIMRKAFQMSPTLFLKFNGLCSRRCFCSRRAIRC